MNKFFIIAGFLLVSFYCLFPAVTQAADQSEGISDFSIFINQSGFGGNQVGDVSFSESASPINFAISYIAVIIRYGLSVLGVVFFVLVVYGGFLWMTAGGNEEQLTKAKSLLKNSSIGLVIVLSAYAITYFVLFWAGRGLYQTDLTGSGL